MLMPNAKDPLAPPPHMARRGQGPTPREDGRATEITDPTRRPVQPESEATQLAIAKAGLASIARAAEAEGNGHFQWLAQKTLTEINKEVSPDA